MALEQAKWLGQVVRGFFAYHAVPTNTPALNAFRHRVMDIWRRSLKRRSQRDRTTWERIAKLADDFLPKPLCVPRTPFLLITRPNRLTSAAMIALLCFLLTQVASPLKSKSRLEAENAALRHQLIVLQRRVRGRIQLTNGDRLFFVQLYRWFPSVLKAITIIRPETVVRWHRADATIAKAETAEAIAQ